MSDGEAEVERALVGLEDLAAFIETLWRKRLRLRVRISRRTVQRYLKRGLPAQRVAGGPWLARPSEVATWWESSARVSTRMSYVGHHGRSAQ